MSGKNKRRAKKNNKKKKKKYNNSKEKGKEKENQKKEEKEDKKGNQKEDEKEDKKGKQKKDEKGNQKEEEKEAQKEVQNGNQKEDEKKNKIEKGKEKEKENKIEKEEEKGIRVEDLNNGKHKINGEEIQNNDKNKLTKNKKRDNMEKEGDPESRKDAEKKELKNEIKEKDIKIDNKNGNESFKNVIEDKKKNENSKKELNKKSEIKSYDEYKIKSNNTYNDIEYNNKDYSIRKKGVMGLKNLTNTCFMNSSLQCLAHLKPLYEKLKKEKKLNQLGKSFYQFLDIMYENSKNKYFNPEDILDNISELYEQYKEGRQQGANEFISNFLKSLHEELNSQNYDEKVFDEPANTLLKQKFKKKCNFYKKNKSLIIDLFYGNIALKTYCYSCKEIISAIYSIYNILELSIYKLRDKYEINLEELFDSNSSNQNLDYNIYCPLCKKEVSAYSKNKISHTPDILIIYINKVICHKYYDNIIKFPNELNLTNYISEDKNKNKEYELKGFIEHYGSEFSGHYISKCKNFLDNEWYKFNDTLATLYNKILADNRSQSVIILFYQRKNK